MVNERSGGGDIELRTPGPGLGVRFQGADGFSVYDAVGECTPQSPPPMRTLRERERKMKMRVSVVCVATGLSVFLLIKSGRQSVL